MDSIDSRSELLRDFLIAAHGNLPLVKEMLDRQPALLNVAYQWEMDDFETGIQAAAHMGDVPIAEFLLEQGAPLSICTAAMLGRVETVDALIREQPARIHERGAHNISLLPHAALSGNVSLLDLLAHHGCSEDASFALSNAVTLGWIDAARWLLEHTTPDLTWADFEGHTPLQIAEKHGFEDLTSLLRNYASSQAS